MIDDLTRQARVITIERTGEARYRLSLDAVPPLGIDLWTTRRARVACIPLDPVPQWLELELDDGDALQWLRAEDCVVQIEQLDRATYYLGLTRESGTWGARLRSPGYLKARIAGAPKNTAGPGHKARQVGQRLQTPLNRGQARELASRHIADRPSALRGPSLNLALQDELTQEHSFGWVFFYNSAEYVRTRDPAHGLGGNPPLIVERDTGRVFVTGTAEPVDVYVRNYLDSGDPHARPGSSVAIEATSTDTNRTAVVALVRSHLGLPMLEAKKIIDGVADGVPALLKTPNPATAAALVVDLEQNFVLARQLPERF